MPGEVVEAGIKDVKYIVEAGGNRFRGTEGGGGWGGGWRDGRDHRVGQQ